MADVEAPAKTRNRRSFAESFRFSRRRSAMITPIGQAKNKIIAKQAWSSTAGPAAPLAARAMVKPMTTVTEAASSTLARRPLQAFEIENCMPPHLR
jgi:hypothetical protein